MNESRYTMLRRTSDNTYANKDATVVVVVDEHLDSAVVWRAANLSTNHDDTAKLYQQNHEWLEAVFNLYGFDFNDSCVSYWIEGYSPINGDSGMEDHLVF